MKVINAKFAAFSFAAVLLASCSDSSSEPGGNPSPIETPDVTSLAVTETDAAALAARVTNYKGDANAAKALTRAANATLFDGLTSMPNIPGMPSTATEATTQKELTNGTFNVAGDQNTKVLTVDNIQNAVIYVKGGRTLEYKATAGGNKIYVSKGGKIVFKGTGSAIAANDEVIVNEGTFASDNDITIDGKLYSTCSLGNIANGAATQNVTVNGGVYLAGVAKTKDGKVVTDENGKTIYESASVRAKNLTINGKLNTNDKVSYTDKVTVNGALHVANTFIANELTVNGQISSDYSIKVSKALTMNAGAKMSTAYLNVTDNSANAEGTEAANGKGEAVATLNGNCQITLADKAVVNVNTLKTDNTDNQITLTATGTGNVAVIKADKFIYAGSDAVKAFRTPGENQAFLFQFTNIYQNGAEADANLIAQEDLDADASFLDFDDKRVAASIEPVGNHAWQLKSANIAELKKLDLISSVQSPDGQSATCIWPTANNKVLVSYHTRGANFGANIDVASVATDGKVTVDQSIKDNASDLDFNHLMVAGNNVYVTGSSKDAGAMVAYIPFDGTKMTTTAGLQMLAVNRNEKGYDANSAAMLNGNLIVASTRGYEIFQTTNGNTHTYLPAPGKVKHLAVKDNQLYGLNYTSTVAAGNAAVEGELQIFKDANLTDVTRFTVGQIAPNNGKNTVAVDGTDIYVCQSAKGLHKYNATGTEQWTYVVPQAPATSNNQSVDHVKGYVNGVAVKGDYVYVAAGAYGLVVLNKADGQEVCHRSINGGKNSANYVAVDDNDNIYVAYGQGRIQVLKVSSTVK